MGKRSKKEAIHKSEENLQEKLDCGSNITLEDNEETSRTKSKSKKKLKIDDRISKMSQKPLDTEVKKLRIDNDVSSKKSKRKVQREDSDIEVVVNEPKHGKTLKTNKAENKPKDDSDGIQINEENILDIEAIVNEPRHRKKLKTNKTENEDKGDSDGIQINEKNILDIEAVENGPKCRKILKTNKAENKYKDDSDGIQINEENILDTIKKPKKVVKEQNSKVKKIVDVQPLEVGKQSLQKNKRKKQTLQEDDVAEEDLDQFCNEIGEEENKQYENWVKLIEAKLHPKK